LIFWKYSSRQIKRHLIWYYLSLYISSKIWSKQVTSKLHIFKWVIYCGTEGVNDFIDIMVQIWTMCLHFVRVNLWWFCHLVCTKKKKKINDFLNSILRTVIEDSIVRNYFITYKSQMFYFLIYWLYKVLYKIII